jgi:hypothetical protein
MRIDEEAERNTGKSCQVDTEKRGGKMSGLLTNFSVRDIQQAIRATKDPSVVCIRNVAWGFFKNIEVDFLTESSAGYLCDYEIKRSKEDFLADFKKKHFHDDIRLMHLVYVLPDALANDWLKNWCAENYKNFRRSFDFKFYNSTGDICNIHEDFEWKIIVDPYYHREKVYNKFHTSNYLTPEMTADIISRDQLYDYRRKLFVEEKVQLYRLAIIKGAWAK